MTYIGWSLIAVFLMAAGVLFFSVNAIALRTFSSAKLYEAFKSNSGQFKADKLIENSEKLTLTCSLYVLILNICIALALLSIMVKIKDTPLVFIDYLIIFAITLAIFSIASLGIPHAWAKYSGEKILAKTYIFLNIFAGPVWPMLCVFRIYDKLVKRLAGIQEVTAEQEQEEKEEEFLTDLEQQRIDGVVDAEEQEMIENVLELTDTTASEILTPRTDVIAIEAGTKLNTIIETITLAGHSRYPVYEENVDKIIGLVYAKDLIAEIGKDPTQFKLSDKMREAYFVPETKPLRQLLHEFQNQKQHIAVVLDEFGGTAGIVTLEDILEELVGEIADEYEKPEDEPIVEISKDTIEVDARTYIDDLNDKYELGLPEEEDYDTVGGFVFSHLGYIPKISEQFDYENLKFTITKAEPRKIVRIKIVRSLPQEND